MCIRDRILTVPSIKLAMYSRTVAGPPPPGCGPFRFDFEIKPLPLATSNRLPSGVTRTDVGYQPTGIKPSERLLPGVATSKTGLALRFALAPNTVASSGDSARLLGLEPG